MAKKGIHPVYKPATITCACGNKVDTYLDPQRRSRSRSARNCHPFYTGKQKFVDAAGRIERFKKKYATGQGKADKAAAAARQTPASRRPRANGTRTALSRPTWQRG